MGELDPGFKYEVMREPGGEQLKMCFSCTGCTVSCPVSEIEPMYNPRRYIHQTLVGMRDEVLGDEHLWKCVQCHSCYEYCPQDVKVTELISVLRSLSEREAKRGRVKIKNPLYMFENAFAESVRRHGRVHESMVIAKHIWKTKGLKGLMEFMPLGKAMFFKGKISLFAKSISKRDQVQKIFEIVREGEH